MAQTLSSLEQAIVDLVDQALAPVRELVTEARNGPRALTPQELADRLGVSASLIQKMAGRGELPHFRLGSLIRFPVPEVEAWLAERTVGPGACSQ